MELVQYLQLACTLTKCLTCQSIKYCDLVRYSGGIAKQNF